MTIPSYPKVLTIGTRGTERLLEGPVVVQEKIDGSQFRIGIMGDGSLEFASHHQPVYPGAAGMFEPVVQHVLSRREWIAPLITGGTGAHTNLYVYGEYLAKPKQNTLCYERAPLGYLVLFDYVLDGYPMTRLSSFGLAMLADALDCEMVQNLHEGRATMADLDRFLTDAKPMLGGPMVEGVVVKNYAENIQLGGQVFPLFCKHVSTAFKERHAKNPEYESGKTKMQRYYDTFCTEARWVKAVQHMREAGTLQDAPQDIGPLMKEIATDLEAEEADNIREALYQMHRKDIVRAAQRGFAEWYKARLAERIGEGAS